MHNSRITPIPLRPGAAPTLNRTRMDGDSPYRESQLGERGAVSTENRSQVDEGASLQGIAAGWTGAAPTLNRSRMDGGNLCRESQPGGRGQPLRSGNRRRLDSESQCT